MPTAFPIELYIGGVENREGKVFLLVRCIEGTIPIETIFDTVFTLTFRRTGSTLEEHRHNFRKVSVKLISIEAYRRPLNAISPGLTARVEVSGPEAGALSKDDVLAVSQRPDQNEDR